MLAAHRDVRELVEIGAYVAGTDADADPALARMPRIEALPAPADGRADRARRTTWARLHELVAP